MAKAQCTNFGDAVNVRRIVQSWSDDKLADELIYPTRLTLPSEDLTALITEALSRLLRRRKKK